MKVKFSYATGRVITTYSGDTTLEEAVAILKDPNVIDVLVVKETSSQYFKRVCKDDKKTDPLL